MINPRDPQTSIRRALSAARCLLVMLVATATACAQKSAALIDITLQPATTSIHWTLNATLHTVHGTFKLQSGAFTIDPANGNATGQIVIDATSGESADSARDKNMHNNVLQSPQYPTITFRPTHVEGKVELASTGPVTVSGILNLHGRNHPMKITVTLHPQPTAVSVTAHFSVPFVAWGLKDPSTFIFRTDKEVTLDIDATATPNPR